MAPAATIIRLSHQTAPVVTRRAVTGQKMKRTGTAVPAATSESRYSTTANAFFRSPRAMAGSVGYHSTSAMDVPTAVACR